MIIFEGPDGGGKSTLAKYVSNRLSLDISSRVVSKEATAMVDLVRWVEDNVSAGFQDIIFDRHRLISETIYGPALRAKLERRFDDLTWFSDQLTKFYDLDPVIVYCIPPLEVVTENVLSDDDNKIFHDQPELITKIWSGYVTRYCLDSIISNRVFHYDYTQEDPSIDWKGVIAHQIGNILYKEGNKK